jgi:hypothetical protein
LRCLGSSVTNGMEEEFALPFINRHVEQFQKLYPYSIFISPAILDHEVRCSICNAKISIRSGCEHEVGEIYEGVRCLRVVTKFEQIETSFVTDPVQKYSVPFMVDRKTGKSFDHYDYSVVSYVVRGLRSPFDGWSMVRTTRRQPHKRYKHVGRNAKCPCASGKKYKSCCLREEGVLRPHIDIEFSVPPTKTLPPVAYSRM